MAQSSQYLPLQYLRHLPLKPLSTEKSPYSWFRLPQPADTEVPPGAICWGAVGEMPSPEPLHTYGFEVRSNEKHDEISRTEREVRVENPDDPDQYIMVKRADQMIFGVTKLETSAGTNTSAETPKGIDPALPFAPVPGSRETRGQLTVNLKNGPFFEAAPGTPGSR